MFLILSKPYCTLSIFLVAALGIEPFNGMFNLFEHEYSYCISFRGSCQITATVMQSALSQTHNKQPFNGIERLGTQFYLSPHVT